MDQALILETTFLIDLEREYRRGEGAATAFLEENEHRRLFLTFTVAGELAAGYSVQERGHLEGFLAPFRILPFNLDVCWEYAQAYRYLRKNGQLIGSNDLWIASTALAFDLPVVTRNREHFQRVPRVQVVGY